MAYDKLLNVEIWNDFFSTANKSHYEVLYHAKSENMADINLEEMLFEKTLIPAVWSEYFKLSYPMNALFDAGLLRSSHTQDTFMILSTDSIPVKSFDYIYSHFCAPTLKAPKKSMFCIVPTNQWKEIKDTSLMVVKHHQWLILNRDDAMKSVAMWKIYPNHEDMYNAWVENGYQKTGEVCWEEYWFYSAIHGRFYDTKDMEKNDGITYPHDGVQGKCPMYVHWPGYSEDLPFMADGIPLLNEDTDIGRNGNTDLGVVPIEFLHRLKHSKNFFFVRKFNEGRNKVGARLVNGTVISIKDAVSHLQMVSGDKHSLNHKMSLEPLNTSFL